MIVPGDNGESPANGDEVETAGIEPARSSRREGTLFFLRGWPDGSFAVESAEVCLTPAVFEMRLQDGRVVRIDRAELDELLASA